MNNPINLDSMVHHLPNSIYIKNVNFQYVGCSQHLINSLKISNKNVILGCDDFNLPWNLKYGDLYRENDKMVISTNQTYRYIHPLILSDRI